MASGPRSDRRRITTAAGDRSKAVERVGGHLPARSRRVADAPRPVLIGGTSEVAPHCVRRWLLCRDSRTHTRVYLVSHAGGEGALLLISRQEAWPDDHRVAGWLPRFSSSGTARAMAYREAWGSPGPSPDSSRERVTSDLGARTTSHGDRAVSNGVCGLRVLDRGLGRVGVDAPVCAQASGLRGASHDGSPASGCGCEEGGATGTILTPR